MMVHADKFKKNPLAQSANDWQWMYNLEGELMQRAQYEYM